MSDSHLLSILIVIHPAVKAAIQNADRSKTLQKIAKECKWYSSFWKPDISLRIFRKLKAAFASEDSRSVFLQRRIQNHVKPYRKKLYVDI